MSTTVDELVVKLELDSKPQEWTKADHLVESLRAHLTQISVDIRMASSAFNNPGIAPKLKKEEKEVEKSSTKIMGWLKGIAAAWLGFQAISGLKHMIGETIELGGKLNDLSTQTGIGAEALQGYAHAAKLNGTTLDNVVTGIQKLNVAVSEAAKTGKGPAADGLRELGLSAAGVNKVIQKDGLEAGFDMVAKKLATLPDGAQKNRLAFQLLGKSGRELIPTINGLAEAQKDAEDLGLIVSAEDIKNLDDLGDDTDRLKGALGGLKNQAVAALVPLMKELAEGALDWLKTNRDLIKSGLESFVSGLSTVFKIMATAVKGIVAVFGFLVDNSDLVITVLEAIGVVIAFLSAEFVLLGIEAAAAWIVAFAPIAAAVVIVTGLILAVKLLIKHWDKVKDAVRGVGRAIVDALAHAWQGVKDAGNRIMEFFTEDVPNAIRDAFNALWEGVKQGAKDAAAFLEGLPIIKQAMQVGGFIKEGVGGDLAVGNQAMDAIRANQEASRAPDAAGGVTVQGGPVSIEVNSQNGDPVAIGNEIDKRMREHMDTLLTQTADNL